VNNPRKAELLGQYDQLAQAQLEIEEEFNEVRGLHLTDVQEITDKKRNIIAELELIENFGDVEDRTLELQG